MTPEQNEMVRRLKLAQISGCRADYALLGALPLDRVRGDIRELTDLVTDQAAELATLRAVLEYIMDGYGLNPPEFKQEEYDEDGERIADDWIVTAIREALKGGA